jgi:hypothetical protein
MAEVTLADYTGYIFNEMIRAREMADAYARQVAEAYARDPVMKHFSVPRFKVPSMELTIPVLVAGAQFRQVVTFRMSPERFREAVNRLVQPTIDDLKREGERPIGEARRAARPMRGPRTDSAIDHLYKALVENPEPLKPEAIVESGWKQIFFTALSENDVLDRYRRRFPGNDPFTAGLIELQALVRANTIISSTAIQSLLVNPETNTVKNGSDAASVFTIKASIVEEGFYIHTIKDKDTGAEHQIVDFE